MTNSKMRASMFYGPNNMVVEELPLSLKENEVLLKMDACAVCGYDVRVFRNGHRKVRPPIILGHEICGRILHDTSTSDGILSAGTRVAVLPIMPCLKCQYCNNKEYNLCNNLMEIGSTVNGGFAEYIKIPQQVIKIGGLIPVPDNLSNEEAALLEPLACCLNGFSKLGQVEKDKSVLIIGDGPIGLLHLQLSRELYGLKTAVVGKIPFRLESAKSIGADAAFAFDDRTIDKVMDFTGGVGANIVVIATSNPEALNFAKKIASKNSKINMFAGLPNDQSFSLDPNWLHYNQVSIMGSFSSTPTMFRKAAILASNGTIDLSKIVTHRYSLDNIKQAFLATEEYHGLRTIIDKFE